MSDADKQVVVSFLERMSAGDIGGAFELIGDDATWFSLSSRRHVDAQSMRPAIETVFGTMLEAPIRQQVLLMTAEDDRVAVVSEGHAVTLDGVPYENMYHFLFQLRDGRIVAVWEFNDTAHATAVLRRGPDGGLGLPDQSG
jgi:ketosteroid isomerase-like protein